MLRGSEEGGLVLCYSNAVQSVTSVPVTMAPAISIDCGFAFACALQRDGAVICWGSNSDVSLLLAL
jgi:alpha-tubulin suppressor-like RCC1 family protein